MPTHIRLALQIGVGAAIILAGFTILASMVLLGLTGTFRLVSHPYWAWWVFLIEAGSDSNTRTWLAISGVPAALVSVIGGGVMFYEWKFYRVLRSIRRAQPTDRPHPAITRAATDVHGHARFMEMKEARRLWPGPDPSHGGVVIGEAYNPVADRVAATPFDPRNPATWGMGGKSPLLIDPCVDGSTHSLLFSGSGGFKTVSSAIPTLLYWRGSAVVLDPSLELSPMLTAYRQTLGSVFTLHPNTALQIGFNALDWIDINSPMAETDIAATVEWVAGDTPGDSSTSAYFVDRAKKLVICLLSHMLWAEDLPTEMKTLRTLRAGLVTPEPELRDILEDIYRSSRSDMARDLAGSLKGLSERPFSSLYATADECTAWLSNRAFAGLVSGSSFRSSDVAEGRVTIFIALPLKALQASPAVARTIVGALLNAVYEREGRVPRRVLFLLDEVSRLGYMSILETARDDGRKYGITLHLIYQGVGQMVQQFGKEGRDVWYESANWRGYAGIRDLETARELSAIIGDYGALSWSEGENSGRSGKALQSGARSSGSAITYHATGRPVMRPEELMNDLRKDALIVVPNQGRPLIAGRAIYFRRPDMRKRVSANRFARKE